MWKVGLVDLWHGRCHCWRESGHTTLDQLLLDILESLSEFCVRLGEVKAIVAIELDLNEAWRDDLASQINDIVWCST